MKIRFVFVKVLKDIFMLCLNTDASLPFWHERKKQILWNKIYSISNMYCNDAGSEMSTIEKKILISDLKKSVYEWMCKAECIIIIIIIL